MPTLLLPMPLRPYAGNRRAVQVQGRTVHEVLQNLVTTYPRLRPHLFDEQGRLQPYVHIFLNGEDVRSLQGPDTPVTEDAELRLLPSIAGGGRHIF